MIKMLVIADDFTGALDTGVQFTRQGLYTKISTNINFDYGCIDDDLDILVIDAQTRHLSPEKAYSIVKEISQKAIKCGVKYLYKKTDSALRGNIGAELSGLLDGSGEKGLYFVPALPLQNRVTIDSIHYIDGVPVANSVFGKDPFEPVVYSNVIDILKTQTDTRCLGLKNAESITGKEKGIVVIDAVENYDLENIVNELYNKSNFKVFAGCAGLASFLPNYLKINKKQLTKSTFDEGLLVACGSVNPISTKQVKFGSKTNFDYYSLSKQQKIDPNWCKSYEYQYKELLEKCTTSEFLIIDANDKNDQNLVSPSDFSKENNVSIEIIRENISNFIGQTLIDFLELGCKKNIMIIGGDTLFAFINKLDLELLEPIEEILPGVVVSTFKYKNNKYNIISKSGGFGEENLILEIKKIIKDKEAL